MLSVDGDADAAVEARIGIAWNKFRQLVPLKKTKTMLEWLHVDFIFSQEGLLEENTHV